MGQVALKANQVRTRINKNSIRTYYIVAEDHNHEFHCLWFRTEEDAPMMMIAPGASYRPTVDDIIVLDNINLLTNTFAEIVAEEQAKVSDPVIAEKKTAAPVSYFMETLPVYNASAQMYATQVEMYMNQMKMAEWQKEVLKYMEADIGMTQMITGKFD